MELRYDDDDLMAQNHNWSDNWTDFNQEIQNRQAKGDKSYPPEFPVEDRVMLSNQIHGGNRIYNYFMARNQIIGGIRTYFNQGRQQSCANLQGSVSTLVSPPTVEDITPENQNQDDNQYIHQEEQQRCVKLQDDLSTSSGLVSPPTVEDTRTPGNQNQGDKQIIIQEQQQGSGNVQGGEDDFIPLSTEYPVEEEEYNIYVGGISNDTDEQNVKDFFTKFGEVKRVYFKRCPTIRKPWNFAFVTFSSKAAVDSAMASTPLIIDGQRLSVGRTSQRKFPSKPRIVQLKKARMFIGMRSKRIHVGGIKSPLTDAEILYYFEKFGKVEKLDHPVDRQRHRPKSFCLVTFENEATVQQVCRKFIHKISGQKCRVKRARDQLI